MRLQKYRPAFFTGFEDEFYEVNTKEELFESALIKPLTEYPNFYRISYSQNSDRQLAIMLELNKGYEWWVIALVHNKEDIKTLKEWLPKIEYKSRIEIQH